MTPQDRLKEIAENNEDRFHRLTPAPFYAEDIKFLLSLIAKLQADVRIAREGLEQAVDTIKRDYVPTPLDGYGALIRKLDATLAKLSGVDFET